MKNIADSQLHAYIYRTASQLIVDQDVSTLPWIQSVQPRLLYKWALLPHSQDKLQCNSAALGFTA